MKSMQRQFGKIGKRSENQADTQTVLAEFQAVDNMLDRVCLGLPPISCRSLLTTFSYDS